MAINYGSGELGSVTLTTNTTLEKIREYENLTIDAGVTVTVPSGALIQVRDTLTIEGTLTIDKRLGSGTARAGVPDGGDAGGAGVIIAKNVAGSGTIRADGEDGAAGGASGGSNGGNYAATGLPPTIPGKVGEHITEGAQSGQDANGTGGIGSGGTTSPTIMDHDMLNILLDQWTVPAAHVSTLLGAKILSGGAGAGGSGGAGNYGNYASGGDGGGGAAGGACGGRGGNGSSGNGGSNGNGGDGGADGGSGGGAGGVIIAITESLPSNITTNAIGGIGGSGGTANNYGGNGGHGGGGGGGSIIAITPDAQTPQYDASGGASGGGGANAGKDGVFKYIPFDVVN